MKIQFIFLGFLIFILLQTSFIRAAEHKLLGKEEIQRFIKDTPTFVTEVKKVNEGKRLIELFLHPENVDQDTIVKNILEQLSWDPERYAYIFSRVIIAGFIRDMGEFGDKKLNFMKDQLDKWKTSNEPEPEKSQMIQDLTTSIKDLEVIVERTNSIPKMELLLMWNHRDALNDVLMGKLPIGRKRMKVLN